MRAAAPATPPRTAGEWMDYIAGEMTARRLHFGHGAESARAEALWLVAHVLRRSFDEVLEQPARRVPPRAAARLETLLALRVDKRRPLAYLLREAWLGPYRFYVDERAIVPRSFIAHWLLERPRPRGVPRRSIGRVLDLCTGSGCLAILAAFAFPHAQVDAVDISADALAVARRNVRHYRLSRRVRLHRGNLFAPTKNALYDVIIANPPYVDRHSMQALPPEYAAEPDIALVGGADGLEIVQRILTGTCAHLRAGGLLVMEVGRHRRRVERRFPRIPLTWLEHDGRSSMVLMVGKADLADLT